MDDAVKRINAPIGERGSGMVRYAAAMAGFRLGLLSAEALEVFRCCSKFDKEDPVAVAQYLGVALPDLVTQATSDPQGAP